MTLTCGQAEALDVALGIVIVVVLSGCCSSRFAAALASTLVTLTT